MIKGQSQEAKKHFMKLREIIAHYPSSIFRMSKEDAIRTLRKTREAIWKEKVAVRH
jgi:hypothetical protein